MVLPPTPSAGVRAAELAENGYFRTVKAIRRYSTHFFNTYSIMRRSILHLAIVAIAGLSFASAQAQDGSDAPILRDNRVDTAILSRPIDPKMDLSRLPLYLLRIYRQIPAAQQGYWIMQQDLNALFSQTDWYENRADEAASHEDGEPFRAVLKPDEQAFVDRVQARERELLKQNFTVPKGYRVNLRNLANPYQFEALPAGMQEALARNGFVIVPQNDIQLFHVYENNDYHNFPSFVTTDLHLQLFHMYFDFVLRQLEQEKLIPMLSTFAGSMYNHMKRQAETAPDAATRAAAEYNQTYYAVGCALLTGRPLQPVPAAYRAMAELEMKHVAAARDDFSEFFGYTEVKYPYSLYRPRGHYTRNKSLERYFRAMMWFQTAPACLDNDRQFRAVVLQAAVLSDHPEDMKRYDDLMEPIAFLVGEPDNVAVRQVADLLRRGRYVLKALMTDDATLEKFRREVKVIAEAQNRIRPDERFELSCRDKINLMPQRYLADSEVMLGMVDNDSPTTRRGCPRGLDVFAAFGNETAERILLDELKEATRWDQFTARLSRAKERMAGLDRSRTVYNRWMEALLEMSRADTRYPYFMQTPLWAKKNLNTSLASWAELRHDVILYGEQPVVAECGAGGLPDPYTVGYVEPNTRYWRRAIELIDLTASVLRKHGLTSERIEAVSQSLREQTEFLLRVSEKELSGQALTEEEYNQIETVGSNVEWITLEFLREGDEPLSGWDDVHGADKSVAVVADVFTANGGNNPEKCVLYEATGYVDHLYVVVEIEGYLYLTRGAVFSYHEFSRAVSDPRMTDEEWQKTLEKKPRHGVPDWMRELILPGAIPADNEKVFYSGGC